MNSVENLDDIDRWKATEFREFLLYTGPVVLRSVVSEEFYGHFLILHVAMSILASLVLSVNKENVALQRNS